MEVCKITNCLFYADIECSCSLNFCKLHYKKHFTENLDHQGHKIYRNINKDSRKEILNFLYNIKIEVSHWAAKIKILYVKDQTKFQITEISYITKRILDIINNCVELITKIMKTSKFPVKICYNPIEFFLMQPLSKTKKYISELNLNISGFSCEILSENLVKIQNHLYNYNYLYEIHEDFHGGEIQKEKELIMELFNIAGSLLDDDEYYNSKYLYKGCRKILEKIHYHKQIDFFFIDYYIYMIKNRINPNCEIIEPLPKPDNFISPYFVDFLDYISRLYTNWGKAHRAKEFLKNNIKISKMAFISQDHHEGWLCFCKGIVHLYASNYEKSVIYFKASKIYFKRLRQFDYLALMYYHLGFLYNSRLITDAGFIYTNKSKNLCKKYDLLLLLEKVYFWRGYLLIYQHQYKRAEKYLKKGEKLLNGPGKRYDVAFFKLNIFSANLPTAYELLKKINKGFPVLPIQNRVLGWLYSEVGFLYFLFGDIEQAESYFRRINLDSIKPTDWFNLVNVLILSLLYYFLTFRFEKAEEILNIIAKKFVLFNSYMKFSIDLARILFFKILSPDESLKTDQELEKVKIEINRIELPIWFSSQIKDIYWIIQSLCNKSKNWSDLFDKIMQYVAIFSDKHPLFAHLLQMISQVEETLGNYERAKICLFKSLESLKKFVSPKNPQLKKIEDKISEIEKKHKISMLKEH